MQIDQLAAFELSGIVFTQNGDTGYWVGYIDKTTLLVTSKKQFSFGTKWKIYQSRVDNHMHRPIWGVNETQVSAISRITTTYS